MSMALLLGITANAADDLHKWRLTENSVKISFRDTDINEKGFRIVDADTNARLSIDVIPLEGTGTAGIIKVVGLSAGTDYSVKVEAFFEDAESNFSEPFDFKTNGESNDDDITADNVATDLQSWRVAETSVKISFKDNDDKEEYFRIIVTSGSSGSRHIELSPLEGTGKFGIGKVTGLTPGTTYTFRVHNIDSYRYDMGLGTIPIDFGISKSITVTTKGEAPSAATDLKAWRVRETTALLAFKDNSSDEIRYDIRHNRNGRVLATGSSIAGQGGYAAIKLRNLLPGITTPVVIETVHDGEMILSEEYNITTKGEAEEGSTADVLMEGTTENSVNFSFRFDEEAHIGGDSNDRHPAVGVKIHNMKTNKIVENVNYTYDNMETKYRTEITGLNSNTEYTFTVETVYNDGTPLTLSEPFTFRTK